jgi:hypothetical protein
MARGRAWWATQKWEAEALCKDGVWRPIYCSASKASVLADAAAWTAEMKQPTRVGPGPGHLVRRQAAGLVRVPPA